jgi:hypothetical protein
MPDDCPPAPSPPLARRACRFVRHLFRRGFYEAKNLLWIACHSPVYGWQYRMGLDLDLCNVTNFPLSNGVGKIQGYAARGWEPCLLISAEAMNFRTNILFRRRRLFPRPNTWNDSYRHPWEDTFKTGWW